MNKPSAVVLASRNPKKVRELQGLLAGIGLRVRSAAEFPGFPEVAETENTFAGNARLKAESAARFTGLPALADDSGLEVDALGGAPGVRSARYAGERAADADNNRLLLANLASVPENERTARFVCVLAFAVPGEETEFFRGECGGRILSRAAGEGGFGYDPLFLSDDLGVTFAAAGEGKKGRVSHRGRALQLFSGYCARRWPGVR